MSRLQDAVLAMAQTGLTLAQRQREMTLRAELARLAREVQSRGLDIREEELNLRALERADRLARETEARQALLALVGDGMDLDGGSSVFDPAFAGLLPDVPDEEVYGPPAPGNAEDFDLGAQADDDVYGPPLPAPLSTGGNGEGWISGAPLGSRRPSMSILGGDGGATGGPALQPGPSGNLAAAIAGLPVAQGVALARTAIGNRLKAQQLQAKLAALRAKYDADRRKLQDPRNAEYIGAERVAAWLARLDEAELEEQTRLLTGLGQQSMGGPQFDAARYMLSLRDVGTPPEVAEELVALAVAGGAEPGAEVVTGVWDRYKRKQQLAELEPIIDQAAQSGELAPAEAALLKVGLRRGDVNMTQLLGRFSQTDTAYERQQAEQERSEREQGEQYKRRVEAAKTATARAREAYRAAKDRKDKRAMRQAEADLQRAMLIEQRTKAGLPRVQILRAEPNEAGFLEIEVDGEVVEAAPEYLARLVRDVDAIEGLSDEEKEDRLADALARAKGR